MEIFVVDQSTSSGGVCVCMGLFVCLYVGK